MALSWLYSNLPVKRNFIFVSRVFCWSEQTISSHTFLRNYCDCKHFSCSLNELVAITIILSLGPPFPSRQIVKKVHVYSMPLSHTLQRLAGVWLGVDSLVKWLTAERFLSQFPLLSKFDMQFAVCTFCIKKFWKARLFPQWSRIITAVKLKQNMWTEPINSTNMWRIKRCFQA